ncbi:uncharacterized protein BDV17DRAFT_288793 [Aspergillus undulatus]|uniref:uncharacterized protein n=1 Tax=Aspergillus undulatus TaxID=1810928 RepID=UPI003CCD5F81
MSNLFHTWRELRESEASRELCVEQFLDIYGVEHWGTANRTKYIMADSLRMGDDVWWPENRDVLLETLVQLVKKKADGMTKGRLIAEPESSQSMAALATPPATAPETNVREETEYEPSTYHGKEAEEDEEVGIATRQDGFSEDEMDEIPLQSTCSGTTKVTTTAHITSPATDISTKALRSKYRRETYFLVATDNTTTAPAWVGYQSFKGASSFLLKMGRERGLEKEWWTPRAQMKAQMELEGADCRSQADYICAAQTVIAMASVKLEWAGDEVLVRWGNDSDWGIVLHMIQKAWLMKELGIKLFDVFRMRVLLHVQG